MLLLFKYTSFMHVFTEQYLPSASYVSDPGLGSKHAVPVKTGQGGLQPGLHHKYEHVSE